MKCDLFKCELHYLGHLIFRKGIYPLPEKLQSSKNLAIPKTAEEVRQMLGLTGHYKKFIPCWCWFSLPLMKLICKTIPFIWMHQFQKAFETLTNAFRKSPILGYPNWNKPYILFTDVSTYAWCTVLTQEHTPIINGEIFKSSTSYYLC